MRLGIHNKSRREYFTDPCLLEQHSWTGQSQQVIHSSDKGSFPAVWMLIKLTLCNDCRWVFLKQQNLNYHKKDKFITTPVTPEAALWLPGWNPSTGHLTPNLPPAATSVLPRPHLPKHVLLPQLFSWVAGRSQHFGHSKLPPRLGFSPNPGAPPLPRRLDPLGFTICKIPLCWYGYTEGVVRLHQCYRTNHWLDGLWKSNITDLHSFVALLCLWQKYRAQNQFRTLNHLHKPTQQQLSLPPPTARPSLNTSLTNTYLSNLTNLDTSKMICLELANMTIKITNYICCNCLMVSTPKLCGLNEHWEIKYHLPEASHLEIWIKCEGEVTAQRFHEVRIHWHPRSVLHRLILTSCQVTVSKQSLKEHGGLLGSSSKFAPHFHLEAFSSALLRERWMDIRCSSQQ